MTVERQMAAPAELIYDAWTKRFDKWFAQPGELVMTPEEGVSSSSTTGTTGVGTLTTVGSWNWSRTGV